MKPSEARGYLRIAVRDAGGLPDLAVRWYDDAQRAFSGPSVSLHVTRTRDIWDSPRCEAVAPNTTISRPVELTVQIMVEALGGSSTEDAQDALEKILSGLSFPSVYQALLAQNIAYVGKRGDGYETSRSANGRLLDVAIVDLIFTTVYTDVRAESSGFVEHITVTGTADQIPVRIEANGESE